MVTKDTSHSHVYYRIHEYRHDNNKSLLFSCTRESEENVICAFVYVYLCKRIFDFFAFHFCLFVKYKTESKPTESLTTATATATATNTTIDNARKMATRKKNCRTIEK